MTDHNWEAANRAWEQSNRYSRPAEITMMQVHGALGNLVHAVTEELPRPCQVEAVWRPGTYLSVEVECYGRDVERVAAQLSHGIVWGHYDFRFRGVSRPTNFEPSDWVGVSASVDLSHVEKHLRKAEAA